MSQSVTTLGIELLSQLKKLEDKNYTKIIAFDETAVWFDAV